MSDVFPELQSDETPGFDDIYVPGIGVRGALSDDDGESSDFGSRVRERCARTAARVNRWAVQTFGNARGVGVRLAVRLNKTCSGTQGAVNHHREFLSRVTNSGARRFEETRRPLFTSVQSAVSRLRVATRNTVAGTAPLNLTIIRGVQKTRSKLLPVAQSISAQIRRANQYRLSLPPISATVARSSRRAQSLLHRAASSSNRLRAAANYKTLPRLSVTYKPDLRTLRRAAAPLTILLIMVVFVIQEITTAFKR
jgi:hypothetical protein